MRTCLLVWACVVAAMSAFSSGAQEPRADSPLTAAQAAMPETVIYVHMRDAKLAPPDRALKLREGLQLYRGYAHEKRRKVNGEWVKSSEFARRRAVAAKYLADAQEEAKGAKTDAEKKAAQTRANAKIMQAAQAWQDPLMRTYLMGLANLRAGRPDPAMTQAKECVQAAPFVPAFHQLYGACLLAKDRPLDAAVAFAAGVRLQADRDGVSLLRQALGKVPGVQINTPAFKRSQETLQAVEAASGANAKPATIDLAKLAPPLPGKSGGLSSAHRSLLPTPAFDRLVFRQSNAVPVAPNVLLIDGALSDAAELYVKLDMDTYAPAKIRRVTWGTKTKPLPLALVTVEGHTFTPVTWGKALTFQDGQRAGGSPVGVLLEMGPVPRAVRGRLAVGQGGEVRFRDELQPGESAAAVVTSEGHLAGVLLGRTDITVEHGGPAAFVPLPELLPLLEQARKGKSTTTQPAKGHAPKAVTGQSFTVIGVITETFEK